MVIPFPPGGGTDLTGRAIGRKLIEKWGRSVVVDNRSGANCVIGADLAAKSMPDGYTLLMITSSHAVNEAMLAKHPYDLVHDFTPLIYATVQPLFLIVYPSLPTRTVREVIALAKAEQVCPATRSRSGTLAADGAAAVGGPSERFGTRVKIEVEKYRKLVKQIGLETE